ncbi:GUN4 domain-containing protein [Chroococcidiopsis thermalis]|uniref:Ribonuclease 3 n=1 Tax=Chroococcidiopsis thermalis (strain PCC 7203) TaxID=251229 RepID=K9UAH0_CHRTP|nr:GUN4 domain-containing protein [Chroococcidiopsis thermalis]AFY91224.1 GUN4 domain protein [Chroococcidiopsis thermalis PCC 7203]
MSDITPIELTIGIAFSNKDLLLQALTHSSYARHVGNPKNHNEWLALLGDTLLELIVVDYLYQISTDLWKKDVMSQKRDELVCDRRLVEFAKQIGLVSSIRVKNENGKTSQKNIAEAFEALLAAIYLDRAILSDYQGFIDAQSWFVKNFIDRSYEPIASNVRSNCPDLAFPVEKLEGAIGKIFHNKALLQKSMTHSSYAANFTNTPNYDNQKLAILGNALLDFVVLHYLYRNNTYRLKGVLSDDRDLLVGDEMLLMLVYQMKLKQFIRHNGIVGSKALTDTFKALLAAIYLDRGISEASEWFVKWLPTEIINRLKTFSDRNSLTSGDSQVNPNNLPSEVGVDYSQLHDLLQQGKWEEADIETREVMLKVAGLMKGKPPLNYLPLDSIRQFPCIDLETIDLLWIKYSNGRFGFSVQQCLLLDVEKNWDKFGDLVGWKVNGIWQSKNERIFHLSAPSGHLPSAAIRAAGNGKVRMSIYSRIESCHAREKRSPDKER